MMRTFVDYLFTYYPKSSGLFDERSAMLLRFKRGHAFEMRFFRQELQHWLTENVADRAMLCCVPSSNPCKLNSVSRITSAICRASHLWVDGSDVVTKRYATPSVCTGLCRSAEVFEKSFTISEKVAGFPVVLLDDVTSTGLSMAVVERLLLEAGATSVYCLALFRTHLLRGG